MKIKFNILGSGYYKWSWILLFIALAEKCCGAPAGLDMKKFKEENLQCHNKHRANHGVKPLSYKNELNHVAQVYADNLAQRDAGMVHSKKGYGENLFMAKGMTVDGYSACNSWYDEVKDYTNYNRDHPHNLNIVGHFTALVWKGSCFMGLGIAKSKTGWIYIVTNYDPPGNVEKKFRSNVFKPGTFPNSTSNLSPFEQLMNEDQVICSDVDSDTFRDQNLECLNLVRQRHGAPPLSYTKEMNNYAMEQAKIWAEAGKMVDNDKYGINGLGGSKGKMNGYFACKYWYQTGKNYDYNSEDNPPDTNGFTRILWKSSRFTGIGIVRSKDGKLYIVSVFNPPGNYKGKFKENVLPPLEGISTSPIPIQSTTHSVEVVTRKKTIVDMVKFRNQNLACHNKYREKHGVKSLSYNNELNSVAQKYAEHLAERDNGFSYSNNGLGENIYLSLGMEVDGYSACNSWYDEINDYSFDKDQPYNLDKVGHFTALVWKGSCFMGVGIATSKSGRTFVVANYDPAGNVRDKFRKNVFKPGTPLNSSGKLSPFEQLMNEDMVICSDVDRETFLKQNLECHNLLRRMHGALDLSYSVELNNYAMKQAEILAKGGKLVKNDTYGMNRFMQSGGKKEGYSPCKTWYQGSKDYDFKSEINPNNTYGFSQMIWNSTHFTGIGISRSNNGELHVVSVYDPPGNSEGKFMDNVGLPAVGGSVKNELIGKKLNPFDQENNVLLHKINIFINLNLFLKNTL